MKYLLTEYADPNSVLDPIAVPYRLRNTPIVSKWVERVQAAQAQYPIDDPARFYGFSANEKEHAVTRINKCVDTINSYIRVIDRKVETVDDQDTLNYLHNIFEQYHGLLDQQGTNFWSTAPNGVQRALSDLNLAVHRCESAARGSEPRHVVTWFGLPKDKMLEDSDYVYAEHTWEPGTVFLNYVEIGKTVEDLATDNDRYISSQAFQPFRHYSADFVVRFSARTARQAEARHAKIYAYYQQHKDQLGAWQHCYTNGQFPLANIEAPIDLAAIANRQLVKSVQLI